MAGKKAAAAKAPQIKLAEKVAKKLAAIDGVVAVTLGGSWAQGKAPKSSDIDLGVYYRAQAKPHLEAIRALAKELDATARPTDFGAWGPWLNGGAWLTIGDQKIDWLYRELEHVVQTITDCRGGRVTVDYQPGHPHGFHNHIYMAEIARGVVLADSTGMLKAMKALAAEYPKGLKQGIVEKHLWEAEFSLQTTEGPAKRGDVFHASGSLFRSAAALVQVLFAINEEWFTNEKGALDAAGHFDRVPKKFVERVEAILKKPDANGVKAMFALVEEVRKLA